MAYLFGLLCISAAVELAVHALPASNKTLRRILGYTAIAAIAGISFALLVYRINLFSILLFVLSGYRIFNIFRAIWGRMHEHYLVRVTHRTAYWLLGLQFSLGGLWLVWEQFEIRDRYIWEAVVVSQLITAIIMAVSVRRHARRMRASVSLEPVVTKGLPSITVAIPARNETEDLHQCLESVLASDYPKLEILVLDDCSQQPRTPDIIRSFAHKGVRFLQGREPQTNWLAKNQAYDDLAKAADGDLIVFIGVDIRLAPDSLRRMVSYSVQKQKKMLCVMPTNSQAAAAVPLQQPMRYLWELALPRRLFRRPPVLSSCWLIDKEELDNTGGFAAASRMIIPEAFFARQQAAKDTYSFLASGTTFGVTSHKSIPGQRRTAVRTAYPQLHRRPEMVALLAMVFGLWSVSLVMLTAEAIIWRELPVVALIAGALAWLLYGYMYRTILLLAYGHASLLQIASFPIAILVHVATIHYSMYKYEFSEVLWKGRNVCLPVMHVTPRLPQI